MSITKVIRAKEIMRDTFIEVDGMLSVHEAIHQMRLAKANVIMVKKRSDDDAHALVLLSDIARSVLAKDRSPERVNIYEIMIKPVVSLPAEMDVRYCARLFDRLDLSVAPVIENDKVIGIVSYGELVLQGLFQIYNE